MATSDHFDGRRFFNPTGRPLQPFSAVPRMLLEPRTPWPRRIDEPARLPPVLEDAAAAITFIGHATFLIQTQAGNLLTDPNYSWRAGPLNLFGPRRVRRPAIDFDTLPPISTVLLSHNHYDHCDLRTLRMVAKRFDPIVVTPVGNARLLARLACVGSRNSTGGRARPAARCRSRSRRRITSLHGRRSIVTGPSGEGSRS